MALPLPIFVVVNAVAGIVVGAWVLAWQVRAFAKCWILLLFLHVRFAFISSFHKPLKETIIE
jgi:hypothetical protein